MAEGVNGGPARFYRRRSRAEQREAFQIASAEVVLLEAKAGRVVADAEVRIHKLDLQIMRLKQKEAKTSARKRSRPGTAVNNVPIGSGPDPSSVQESRKRS